MSHSEFEGKNYLITGAAGGIGNALASYLRTLGANLFLTDIVEVDLDALPTGAGSLASATLDLSKPDTLPQLAQAVESTYRHLDGFINVGAVILRRAEISEVTFEDFDLQYAVNLRAPFFLVRELDRLFVDGASIVLFSSQGWWTGGFGGSMPYATTKAGIIALTRGLARTFAPRNIRVNAVAPGFVDTRMMREGITAEALESLIAQVPLGRLASPLEVAEASSMLLLPAASYMTGTILNVSGGQLIY